MGIESKCVPMGPYNTGFNDARRGVDTDVLKGNGYGLEVLSSVVSSVDFTPVSFIGRAIFRLKHWL